MLSTISLTIEGKGKSLIWLHGMLNSVESDSLYSLVDINKAAEHFQVIRYDACGKSVTGNYQWDLMAHQLAEVIEANHLDSIMLGGTSMGSVTALHYAVKHPEKVKALVLATPPPAWEKRAAVKAVYRKIASKTNQNTIPDFLKRLISITQDPPDFYEQEHPGTRQKLMEYRLSFDPRYYSQIYNGGAASDLPSREQIAGIGIPTLIAANINDENHPLAIAQELNSLIPKSRLKVISDYNDYLKLQETVSKFLAFHACDNKL